MRKLSILVIIALFLNGCYPSNPCCTRQLAANFLYRQKVVATTKQTYRPKNPKFVTLYNKEQKLLTPYRVIGIATISKYNLLGRKRPQETIEDMMKNLAASLGGDALINVSTNNDSIQGHVIQFQRVLT